MIDPNHLLNTILDHMLALLPAEPAAFKRLDDIGDAEWGFELPEIFESGYPESGVHATNATAMQAAS